MDSDDAELGDLLSDDEIDQKQDKRKEPIQLIRIRKPNYQEQQRNLCMDFCSFDIDTEVYSDEEGVAKTIGGHAKGEWRGKARNHEQQVFGEGAPQAEIKGDLRVVEQA